MSETWTINPVNQYDLSYLLCGSHFIYFDKEDKQGCCYFGSFNDMQTPI